MEAPMSRFSVTVIWGKKPPLGNLNDSTVNDFVSRRDINPFFLKKISPDAQWRIPEMRLMSVVFPAPVEPTKAAISPGLTVNRLP
jgi:hypothetical protein